MINFKNKSNAKKGFQTGYYIGIVPGLLLGGVTGALVFPLLTAPIGAGIGALSRDIKMSEEAYKIDMTTGLPKPIPYKFSEEIENTKELVFYSRKINAPIPELIINEKPVCQFNKNSYYIHEFTDNPENLTVCLKSSKDTICQSLTSDFTGKRYFEVIVNSNGKASIFEKKQSQTINYVKEEIRTGKLFPLN